MLSYKIPKAIELLRSKLSVAEQNLINLDADLEYLKEQITIMEVNTARVSFILVNYSPSSARPPTLADLKMLRCARRQ